MRIVGGLDIHRRQITFDYADERSGQIRRGRIAPADRMMLRRWLETTVGDSPAVFAVEACTGWRFVTEELRRAGIEAHLAEPADTAPARGPKRRAKTDRTDARHLRELLAAGRLPESWIPPEQVLEMRARLQLFRDLREEHTAWVQRVHAVLLHQGAPAIAGDLLGADNRGRLQAAEYLSPAGREQVAAALRILDALDAELTPLRRQIAAFARRQPGCTALRAQYGVGEITAVALWAELGDTRRFSSSRKAVRHTGLDITVYSSDGKRPPGQAVPPGLAAAALGAVRGGQVRGPAELPGLRLLPAGRRPPRRQPGRTLRRPQDHPPGTPHPARPGRRGPRPCLTAPGLTRVLVRASAHPTMPAARSCRPPASTLSSVPGLKRPSGRTLAGTPHRSSCRRSQLWFPRKRGGFLMPRLG